MNVKEAWQNHREHSKTLSEVVRQTSLAGLAVVWIFKTGEGRDTRVPADLLLPAALMVFALSVDVLQYAWLSRAWQRFAREKEKELFREHKGDPAFSSIEFGGAPKWVTKPGHVLFWIKFGSVVLGSILLIRFLLVRLTT